MINLTFVPLFKSLKFTIHEQMLRPAGPAPATTTVQTL